MGVPWRDEGQAAKLGTYIGAYLQSTENAVKIFEGNQ